MFLVFLWAVMAFKERLRFEMEIVREKNVSGEVEERTHLLF